MKALRLVLGIFVAVGAVSLMALRTSGQPESQPAISREEAARALRAEQGPPPRNTPATSPARLIWRGLDLSAAPVSTATSQLPDIWEERPPGSRSYEVRADVTVIPSRENMFTAATIYWLRSANRFYVQHDPGGSSTRHFYGPFAGDPNQVLLPPTSRPAGR